MIGPKTTLNYVTPVLDPETGLPVDPEEWITIKKVKGVLSTMTGDEIHIWGGIYVTANHIFYMDYPKGFTVTEANAFFLGEREFDIKFVINLGANQNNRLKIILYEVS